MTRQEALQRVAAARVMLQHPQKPFNHAGFQHCLLPCLYAGNVPTQPSEALPAQRDELRQLVSRYNVTHPRVAYPLSFDWAWLYWYFIRFSADGSPFSHSRCFDLKTAFAVKAEIPIAQAGRSELFPYFRSRHLHTHNALDDAIEQAEIFTNIFQWEGSHGKAIAKYVRSNTVTPDNVRAMVKLSPTGRLEWLLQQNEFSSGHEKAQELLSLYEQFLDLTNVTVDPQQTIRG